MVMTLRDGSTVPVTVDLEAWRQSIHGDKLTCHACHREITEYPHPARTEDSAREYSLANYEACKSCHFDNYTRTLDSMQHRVLASGDQRAPVCTDCHGAHDVVDLRGKGVAISQTCSTCHQEIYTSYSRSVHGKAITEGNADVPDCTDCHGAHQMLDPRTRQFHMDSPDLCATCHTDEKVMSRYGISTNVLKSYLQDFHGVTVSFYKQRTPEGASVTAVCTDCHGIHDIRATDDPESSVIRANLVQTCRKCHPDATDAFPAAWLSHYEPSPTRAPVVYWVKVFYRIFVPLIVGGLVLHIGLDLWRLLFNRLRRKKGRS
jgi:predicted CXXCH cytochrome family protein